MLGVTSWEYWYDYITLFCGWCNTSWLCPKKGCYCLGATSGTWRVCGLLNVCVLIDYKDTSVIIWLRCAIIQDKKSLQNHEQLTLLLRPLRIRIEHRSTWQLCETQVQPTHRRTCTSEHQRTWRQTKSLAKSDCDKKTLDWTLHFQFVLRCKVKSKPTIRFPFLLFSHSSRIDKQTKKIAV